MFLTPEGAWDPNSDVHATNEANTMDFEGNMKPEKERVKILLSDVQECQEMNISSVICDAEVSAMDEVFERLSAHEVEKRNNDVDSHPMQLCSSMVDNNETAHFGATIGASFVKDDSSCLIDEVTVETVEETDSDSSSVTSSSSSENEDSSAESESVEIDVNDDDQLDAIMACATSAGKPSGVKPEELSKHWRIDLESAKRTVNVTSQNCARSENTGFQGITLPMTE